ncbi:hypothetical protein [Klebsiella pneumoniae ISC21]|nr:hypothetical protein [Klebsiella pneumoniae ISC21]
MDVSCHVNHQLKNILSGKIMLNAICFVFFTRYNTTILNIIACLSLSC